MKNRYSTEEESILEEPKANITETSLIKEDYGQKRQIGQKAIVSDLEHERQEQAQSNQELVWPNHVDPCLNCHLLGRKVNGFKGLQLCSKACINHECANKGIIIGSILHPSEIRGEIHYHALNVTQALGGRDILLIVDPLGVLKEDQRSLRSQSNIKYLSVEPHELDFSSLPLLLAQTEWTAISIIVPPPLYDEIL